MELARRSSAWLVIAAFAAGSFAALTQPPASDLAEANRRRAATAELIAAGPVETVALQTLLQGTLTPESPAFATLTVLSEASSLPPSFYIPLAECAARATDDELPLVLLAISGARSRESARLLFTFTGSPYPRSVQDASFAALTRLSGVESLGNDRAAWATWLDDADRLDGEGWARRIQIGLAEQARNAAAARESVARQLIDALRKLHIATPASERSSLLTTLLSSETEDVRRLGFELASRELANGGRLDDEVGAKVISLLSHVRPDVRESAAVLMNQMGLEAGRRAIVIALEHETSPRPAAAMLQATLRVPDAESAALAVRWLSSADRDAAKAAADSLLVTVRTGNLPNAADRERVLTTLRSMDSTRLPPSGCKLLALLGDESDLHKIGLLLASPDPALRLAAGESLVATADFLDDILLAAKNDVQLFELAVRAVVLHWPSVDGFNATHDLRAPSDEEQRRGELAVASAMPATDLALVAEQATEPGLRESLLVALCSVDRVLSERADPVQRAAIARGAALLAELRLASHAPDEAIAAIDLRESLTGERTDVDTRLRAIALICLARFDDVDALDADVVTWLDALELWTPRDGAANIAAAIHERFEQSLAEGDRARLAILESKITNAGPRVQRER